MTKEGIPFEFLPVKRETRTGTERLTPGSMFKWGKATYVVGKGHELRRLGK